MDGEHFYRDLEKELSELGESGGSDSESLGKRVSGNIIDLTKAFRVENPGGS